MLFRSNDTATTEIYTLSLHDALPIFCWKIDEVRQFVAWLTNTNLFNPEIYYLTRLPADINAHTTGVIVIMALVLSVLATLYPSWRASRLDPVEALRYQ